MRATHYFACACVFAIAGCELYGGDDECVVYDNQAGAAIQAYELRDPMTGACQAFGGCDNSCEPCASAALPEPDWAQCNGACEGLAEQACQATARCRAIYAGVTFYQCWGIAPSGPVSGGSCSTLDAYGCSQHDDCMALHEVGSPIGKFRACTEEGEILHPQG